MSVTRELHICCDRRVCILCYSLHLSSHSFVVRRQRSKCALAFLSLKFSPNLLLELKMVFDIKCAVASFIIADKNQNREIRKNAFDLMCYWFEEIPASELNRLDFHLLQDVLMNNINLHVKQDMVFNRLVEWFRHDETEREKYMVELLKLIRLKFIPSPVSFNEIHSREPNVHIFCSR